MCILINSMAQWINEKTYHRTIKMKAVDVRPSMPFDLY